MNAARPLALMSLFEDRRHAGRVLASVLGEHAGHSDLVILALPRGGVPVGYEVARALRAPLDVFVVRKLGVPGYEEVAMGALASGGLLLLNEDLVQSLGITKEAILGVARTESQELRRRELAYRGGRAPTDVSGKVVILVDDGLATGSSMRVAIQALRQRNPARVIAAVPVAAPETCTAMTHEADDMVCAATPQPFRAVGLWYHDFSQTSDEEVHELLDAAQRELAQREAGASAGADRA
jgi:putative phosphoribosyl transferase